MSGRHVVTGVAGFVGHHVAERLLDDGHEVVGIDLPLPDSALRRERLGRLRASARFVLHEADVADPAALAAALPDDVASVVHLAARAGVRASTRTPVEHVTTNVVGTTTVLEAARERSVPHVLLASSSSVYGQGSGSFRPADPAVRPTSVYAATKRADELLAHAYAHLHGLPVTCLRLFTVYGPRGRPDMAYWRFAEALLAGRPVPLYGDGSVVRDMTAVDDVVDVVAQLLGRPPTPEGDGPNWAVHNVGTGRQTSMRQLVALLAEEFGVEPHLDLLPPAAGDVPSTLADTTSLVAAVGRAPTTTIDDGLAAFARWFRDWFARHGSVH